MGEVWLIDENQQIIIHDNPAFIGENIKSLFKNGKGAQIDFSAGQAVTLKRWFVRMIQNSSAA